jgi:hypothetical protein
MGQRIEASYWIRPKHYGDGDSHAAAAGVGPAVRPPDRRVNSELEPRAFGPPTAGCAVSQARSL